MHATGDLSRVGVGWVPAAATGLALLALRGGVNSRLRRTQSCAFLATWRAHFFSAGGKRLPIDASQPAKTALPRPHVVRERRLTARAAAGR